MPRDADPLTLARVVRRAVEVCDPDGSDPALSDLERSFEDADEPITAIENLEERLAIAQEGIDVELDDPAMAMAVAAVLYLAHRRDEFDDDREHILRLAARAEWQGDPPERVRDWLAGERVAL